MPVKSKMQWQAKGADTSGKATKTSQKAHKDAQVHASISQCISSASTVDSANNSDAGADTLVEESIATLSKILWEGATGEAYRISPQQGKYGWNCVRTMKNGRTQNFTIASDEQSGFLWWGSWTYFFDPADVGAEPSELKWFSANDTKKKKPKFVWKAIEVATQQQDGAAVGAEKKAKALVKDVLEEEQAETTSIDAPPGLMCSDDETPATTVHGSEYFEDVESLDDGLQSACAEVLQDTTTTEDFSLLGPPAASVPLPPGLAPPPGLEMFAAMQAPAQMDTPADKAAEACRKLLEEEYAEAAARAESVDETPKAKVSEKPVNSKMSAWCQSVGLQLQAGQVNTPAVAGSRPGRPRNRQARFGYGMPHVGYAGAHAQMHLAAMQAEAAAMAFWNMPPAHSQEQWIN